MGEVLARYADDKGAVIASVRTLTYSIQALTPFWANLSADAVKGSTCWRYECERAKPRTVPTISSNSKTTTRTLTAGGATVRREIGVLQAALNHAHDKGLLIHPISVPPPESGSPRDRWLTRSEAAKLIWHAKPHVRRFVLLALYTGRRATVILDLIWARVDLDARTIRFRPDGHSETNKRRGRIRIPRQLLGHLGRWQDGRSTHVVMFRRAPVASIRTGIRRAAERAGLEGVSPHVLKHTAITWAIKNGLGVEDAAEYFDTSPETIRKHYWHHSPRHQEWAVEIIERRK